MTLLLGICNLEAWHSPSQALFGVDLEVAAGEVVALMGRNGMGRTMVIRALCGLIRPCQGTVQLDGHNVLAAEPNRITRLGVGLVPESCSARESCRDRAAGVWDIDRIAELFPTLGPRLQQDAATLSGGMPPVASFWKRGARPGPVGPRTWATTSPNTISGSDFPSARTCFIPFSPMSRRQNPPGQSIRSTDA